MLCGLHCSKVHDTAQARGGLFTESLQHPRMHALCSYTAAGGRILWLTNLWGSTVVVLPGCEYENDLH